METYEIKISIRKKHRGGRQEYILWKSAVTVASEAYATKLVERLVAIARGQPDHT